MRYLTHVSTVLVSAGMAAGALVGCDSSPRTMDAAVSSDAGPGDSGATDSGPVDSGPPDAGPPRQTPCVDESISQLMLFDAVSPAAINDESTGAGEFRHHIDATGGGLSPTQSYVYARFTDSGLEKVEIDDEAALESTEWDIAFRRFVIRVNSGVGGPGYVTVGRTAPDSTFETVSEVPADLALRSEAYFTETCEYVSDGSGIGSPATALSSFWSYAGCVSMSGNVYVIALPSGRHVKLQVLSYYRPEVQVTCDESNTISSPSGGGNLRVRWAFLD